MHLPPQDPVPDPEPPEPGRSDDDEPSVPPDAEAPAVDLPGREPPAPKLRADAP